MRSFKLTGQSEILEDNAQMFLFESDPQTVRPATHAITIELTGNSLSKTICISIQYAAYVTREENAVIGVDCFIKQVHGGMQPAAITVEECGFSLSDKEHSDVKEEAQAAFQCMISHSEIQRHLKMIQQKANPVFAFILVPYEFTAAQAGYQQTRREKLQAQFLEQQVIRRYETAPFSTEKGNDLYEVSMLPSDGCIVSFTGHIWFENKNKHFPVRMTPQDACTLTDGDVRTLLGDKSQQFEREEIEYIKNLMLNAFRAMQALLQEKAKINRETQQQEQQQPTQSKKPLSAAEAEQLAKELEGAATQKTKSKNTDDREKVDNARQLKKKIDDLQKNIQTHVDYLANLKRSKQNLNNKKKTGIMNIIYAVDKMLNEILIAKSALSAVTGKACKNSARQLETTLTEKMIALIEAKNKAEELMCNTTPVLSAASTSALGDSLSPTTTESTTTTQVTVAGLFSRSNSAALSRSSTPAGEMPLQPGEIIIPDTPPPMLDKRWADETCDASF